jgi:hypothetical protein
MHKPILALLVVAAGVIGAERAADAATLHVNQSDPDAYDTIVFPSFVENPCLDPNVPCRTIVHAEDRADDAPANTVVVLPDPGGSTDVYDGPIEVGDGATRVDLVGAGRGDGGTRIQAAGGQVVRLVGGSHVSDLAASLTGASGVALVGVGDSLAERVAADAPAGQALAIFGSARDVLVSAKYGGAVSGTLSRTTVTATDVGADVPAAARLLDTAILASGSASIGLRVQSTGTGQAGDVRHLTVSGFDRAASVEGTALPAKLRAADSVFAAPDTGVGLALVGTKGSAELERSAVRTQAFLGGAVQAQVANVDGLEFEPGLDAGGHLTAGSALIDRGTAGGVLAGAAEDSVDVDGQARLQGDAVDVGADEVVPGGKGGGGGGDAGGGGGGGGAAGGAVRAVAAVAAPDVAPVLGRLKLTPRRLREGARTMVGFSLSEPAQLAITVAKRRTVRRRAHAAKRRRRLVPLPGTQTVDAAAGAGSVRLARRLRHGSYAVTAIAIDAGGNRSAPVTASLRVLAKRAIRRQAR